MNSMVWSHLDLFSKHVIFMFFSGGYSSNNHHGIVLQNHQNQQNP